MILTFYHNRFKNNSKVIPGSPPPADTPTVNRLMGIFTPVKKVVKLTITRAVIPISILKKALNKGFLFFPIFSITVSIIKIATSIPTGKYSIISPAIKNTDGLVRR